MRLTGCAARAAAPDGCLSCAESAVRFPRLQIRDQLKQKGVTLDDRTRVWQSIDGRRGMIGGGSMSGGMGGGSMVRTPISPLAKHSAAAC